MKIYISADMEGVTGATHWDEMDRNHKAYEPFQEQMSREVAAACEGAREAGADEIRVKDAHGSGRNILARLLPRGVKLIRGWSGHPYSMVQELDGSFDALLMVGYHSRAGHGGDPLSHTMSSAKVESVHINDRETSEFFLHGNIAGKHGVPLAFLSGDADLCGEARETNSGMTTHATMKGVGDSTVSIHPEESIEAIRSGVKTALEGDLSKCVWSHPESFEVKIRFNKHQGAYRASHYTGADLLNAKTVRVSMTDYDDVMRFILFVV